jgi:hypothetical protein
MAGSALRRKDMLLPNWPEVDEIYASVKRLVHRLASAVRDDANTSGGKALNHSRTSGFRLNRSSLGQLFIQLAKNLLFRLFCQQEG